MQFSHRAQRVTPFYVMEMAKAAQALAQKVADSERPMIFLNIGEPDFTAPPLVQTAAERAVHKGTTQYTPAMGLPELRERISTWYQRRFNVQVPASRIVITAGASGALQLACLALINAGDEVLMPDPSYPCNRQFVSAADGRPVLLPTDPQSRFQPTAAAVQAAWTPRTRGVLLASPSNPTGTSIAPEELRRIHQTVQSHNGFTIVDEIYLGLSYDSAYGQTALSTLAPANDVISINSFSKYFNLTGWRLGWMVAPEAMVPIVERLAQNLFICANTVAQYAALACFEDDSIAIYEARRSEFKARRNIFIPLLNSMGLTVPVMPDGAFYAWADCTQTAQKLGVQDSWDFAHTVMNRAHLAITPGRDFGTAYTGQYVRFSTASSMEHLLTAADRLRSLLS